MAFRFRRSSPQSFDDAVRDAWSAGAGVRPADVVEVVFCNMRDWSAWLDAAATLLDPVEVARAQRLWREDERDARLLTYAMHRILAALVTGSATRDVLIGRDELGCPRVEGAALSTSLAHTGSVAAFAFCRHGPVGVDFERVSSAAGIGELLSDVAHPEEAETFRDLGDPQVRIALLELWVRKEAALKALGVGLRTPMASFVAAPDVPVLLHREEGPISLTVASVDMGLDWRAAVASTGSRAIASRWLQPAA